MRNGKSTNDFTKCPLSWGNWNAQKSVICESFVYLIWCRLSFAADSEWNSIIKHTQNIWNENKMPIMSVLKQITSLINLLAIAYTLEASTIVHLNCLVEISYDFAIIICGKNLKRYCASMESKTFGVKWFLA